MNVYEVSAPGGEILGLVRARSPGQALRRINELCGVPCAVLGRRVFFAEPAAVDMLRDSRRSFERLWAALPILEEPGR